MALEILRTLIGSGGWKSCTSSMMNISPLKLIAFSTLPATEGRQTVTANQFVAHRHTHRHSDRHTHRHTHTCAYEHDMVFLSVQGLCCVDYDACEGRSPPDQQRFLPQRQHSLVHEGSVPDELEGPVWQVQRTIDALTTGLINYTLVEGRESGRRSERR